MSRENPVVTDLSLFGYRELRMAGKLLVAFKNDNDHSKHLDDGVHVCFNQNSGNVFLSDEDCNVAMMNGHILEDWFVCPYCGHEGFKEDMEHEPEDSECARYLEEIGVLETDDNRKESA